MFGAKKSTTRISEDRIKSACARITAAPPIKTFTAKQPRNAERRSCFRFANLDGIGGAYDCVVKDVSLNGARIALPGNFILGTETTLICGQTGAQTACRVVWQDGNEAGLRFLNPS